MEDNLDCDIGIVDLNKIYCVDDISLYFYEPFREDMDHYIGFDKSLGYCIDLKVNNQTILVPPMRLIFFCNNEEKIVKIDYIRFKDEVKGSNKKYYSKMIKNEKLIYHKKGFSRICLNALSDGIIVWARLGYKFINPSEQSVVLDAIEKYVNKIKGIEDFDIDNYDTIKSIEIKYLRDKEKGDFTDWFESRYISVQPSMEMEL